MKHLLQLAPEIVQMSSGRTDLAFPNIAPEVDYMGSRRFHLSIFWREVGRKDSKMTQRIESRAQRAESTEQKTESREQRAEDR